MHVLRARHFILACERWTSHVVARIGERVAAGMPEHVSVDRKGEAGARADALLWEKTLWQCASMKKFLTVCADAMAGN